MKLKYKIMLFLTLLIFCVGSVCAVEPDNNDVTTVNETINTSEFKDITIPNLDGSNKDECVLQYQNTTQSGNVTVEHYKYIEHHEEQFSKLMNGKCAIDKTNRNQLIKQYVGAKLIVDNDDELNEYMGEGVMKTASPIARGILNFGYATSMGTIAYIYNTHQLGEMRDLNELKNEHKNIKTQRDDIFNQAVKRVTSYENNPYNYDDYEEDNCRMYNFYTLKNDIEAAKHIMKTTKRNVIKSNPTASPSLIERLCNNNIQYQKCENIIYNGNLLIEQNNDMYSGDWNTKVQGDTKLYEYVDDSLREKSEQIRQVEENNNKVKQAEEDFLDAVNAAITICTTVYLSGHAIVSILEFTQGFINNFQQGDVSEQDLQDYAIYRGKMCSDYLCEC